MATVNAGAYISNLRTLTLNWNYATWFFSSLVIQDIQTDTSGLQQVIMITHLLMGAWKG